MTHPLSVSWPPDAQGPADTEIIEASLDEPQFFGELFRRHATRVHAYVRRRLVDDSASDDIVAETFHIAFTRRGDFRRDGASNAVPWLLGIATNLIRNHRRAEVRKYKALARSGVDAAHDSVADAATSKVQAEVNHRRMAKALARLSPDARDALLLRAWEELSYEEIATILDKPVGTVATLIRRSRQKLRDALDKETR